MTFEILLRRIVHILICKFWQSMDEMIAFLQVTLQKDFGYNDDYVIKTFEQCSEDLRKAKMDLPPPAPESEYPQKVKLFTVLMKGNKY